MAQARTRTLGSASLASASSLVILQIASRGFTFLLSQALVRLASPEAFGTAAIQFDLLLSTILFLSREGFRNALLRNTSSTPRPSVQNVALLPIIIGAPIAFFATLVYYNTSSLVTRSQSHFALSVAFYGIAALTELVSEPFYIRTQNDLRFEVRVRAEGSGMVAKTLTTVLILAFFDPSAALLAFSFGALMNATTELFVYLLDSGRSALDVLTLKKAEKRIFDADLLGLSVSMTKQSLVKHVLTEGDKFMVSRISPLQDQGAYALAANYGSLIARILFQPVEETSRVFFSKTLSGCIDISQSQEFTHAIASARQTLESILLLQTHFVLLMITFGPPFLMTALSWLLPPRYLATTAPKILEAYVFYIPAMAINGILEAFVASVSTPNDLARQSRWMVLFSALYVVSGYLFVFGLGLGDVGLVWANTANSLARAVYCWIFTKGWFSKRGSLVNEKAALPPLVVFAAFAFAGVVTRMSQRTFYVGHRQMSQDLRHIGIGICCLGGCMIASYLSEKATIRQILARVRNKNKSE